MSSGSGLLRFSRPATQSGWQDFVSGSGSSWISNSVDKNGSADEEQLHKKCGDNELYLHLGDLYLTG